MEIDNNILAAPWPEVRDPFLKAQVVVIVPANDFSRAWLEQIIDRIRSWEGAKLRVVGLEALKKPHKVTISIPGKSQDPEMVLTKIECRYPIIKASEWRVHASESKEGSDIGTFLVVGIG